MRFRCFTAFAALLALLVTSSCKAPKQGASSRASQVNLGQVVLKDRTPSQRIYLGSGENVVITPTLLPDGQVRLDVAYDRRDASGEQTHVAQRTVQTQPDQATTVSFDLVAFTFTPRMKP